MLSLKIVYVMLVKRGYWMLNLFGYLKLGRSSMIFVTTILFIIKKPNHHLLLVENEMAKTILSLILRLLL